jgi:3-phytase
MIVKHIITASSFLLFLIFSACNSRLVNVSEANVVPVLATDTTPTDTDDPAIWYNSANPEKSLILGTDKGDSIGGIFVFDL